MIQNSDNVLIPSKQLITFLALPEEISKSFTPFEYNEKAFRSSLGSPFKIIYMRFSLLMFFVCQVPFAFVT